MSFSSFPLCFSFLTNPFSPSFLFFSIDFLEQANQNVVKTHLSPSKPTDSLSPSSSSSTTTLRHPNRLRAVSNPDEERRATLSTSRIPRVLLVSANPIIRRSLRILLRRRGLLFSAVFSGVEAVTAERPDGLAYDAIFVEITLKDMSGIEAAKLIRTESRTNRLAPIILFTPIQGEWGGA